MNKNVIIGIVLAIVALGGGGFLYWDDIVNVIPEEYRSYIPGYVAPPVVVATDTGTQQPEAATVEQYRGKLADILDAIANREGAWLLGQAAVGLEGKVGKFAVSYPEAAGRKNIDATGTLSFQRDEDWSWFNYQTELHGTPFDSLHAAMSSGDGAQFVDNSGKCYTGDPAGARLWYEIAGPLWLFPASTYRLELDKVSAGEDETVILVFRAPEPAQQALFAVRGMELVVRGEEYELVSYTLRLLVDGKQVTRTVRWEQDGDNYKISTDNGMLVVQGERTDSGMVLACAGDNPASYALTYTDGHLSQLAVSLTHDDVEYNLELAEITLLTELRDGGFYTVKTEFKEPTDVSSWSVATFGWPDVAELQIPDDVPVESTDTAGEMAQAGAAEDGEETPSAEESESEEQPRAETSSNAQVARQAQPEPEAEEEAAEEEAEPAPAPAPAPQPAPRPQPAPARPAPRPQPTQATTTPSATAAGSTATARPAAPAPYTQAITAYRGGNLQLAEQKLLQTLRQSPNHAGANYLLGYIYYTRGNYSAAHTYLSRTWRQTRDRQLAAQAQQLLHRMGYPY